MPSRTLPVVAGASDPLPPLPDDEATTTSFDESSEPRPSPQARHVAAGKSIVPDAEATTGKDFLQAYYQALFLASSREAAAPTAKVERNAPCCETDEGVIPAGANTIRIPIGGNLAIEIRANVTSAPKQ